MSVYLKNANFIDWETLEFKKSDILVFEGVNGSIKFLKEIPKILNQNDYIIDCTNKLVTKSFACGHHHAYSSLSRGMPAPQKTPEIFYENLKYIWWNLDKCLDLEIIEASALSTAISCAKNGVTFVIDHHSSPDCVENSLETIAKAFDKVGVSHLLCYEMSDRDGIAIREQSLKETENYLKSGEQGLVGLHASFTVNENLLKAAVNLCEKYNSGIHIHTAEDQIDQDDCMKNYQKRVIRRFSDAGVLKFEKTILAHCLHLTEHEKKSLSESQVYIAANIESNLKNNVGYFCGKGLNNNIMLGTDGMHSDMLRSAKAAYLVGVGSEKIKISEVYNRFRKVHQYIKNNHFMGDGDNNLVILNYDSPTEINQNNFISHFIYGIESKHVESVISSGKLIVRDKRVLNINEDEILDYSKRMSLKLWGKMKKI